MPCVVFSLLGFPDLDSLCLLVLLFHFFFGCFLLSINYPLRLIVNKEHVSLTAVTGSHFNPMESRGLDQGDLVLFIGICVLDASLAQVCLSFI